MVNTILKGAVTVQSQPERFILSADVQRQNRRTVAVEIAVLDKVLRQTLDRASRLQHLVVQIPRSKSVEPNNCFSLTWEKRKLFVVQGTSDNLGFYLIYDPAKSEKRIYIYDHNPYSADKKFRPEEVYFDQKYGEPKDARIFDYSRKAVKAATYTARNPKHQTADAFVTV